MKKMNSTVFVTEANNKKNKKASESKALFLKLGICAAACAFVMLVKYADTFNKTASDLAVTAKYDAGSVDSDSEYDELGKLQFVELPGILEVFSPSNKYPLPIETVNIEMLSDEYEVKLESKNEQYIKVHDNCSVKSCETDNIVLSFDGDYEISYNGKMDVTVEEGQTLKQGDTIGKIASNEMLLIKTNLSGRPVSPKEVFKIN